LHGQLCLTHPSHSLCALRQQANQGVGLVRTVGWKYVSLTGELPEKIHEFDVLCEGFFL
jgi:hypothetical protein